MGNNGGVNTAPTSARRPGRPGYDRETLLDTIIEVFTTHGYDAASLDMLARRLGISKAALYHHFDSKEQMLDLALERALGPLEQLFRDAPAGPAENKIRHIIRGAVIIASEQQRALTLLLRVYGNTDAERRATGRRRALTNELHELFAASAAEGTLRNDLDPWLAARFTFGLVNSLVEWYRPGGEISPEGLADAVLAYVRTGLRMSETGDFR